MRQKKTQLQAYTVMSQDWTHRFAEASEFVRSTKPGSNNNTISDKDKLKVYALYKQAKLGDNYTKEPWMIQLTEHMKWDAWKRLQGMSKETAMKTYVELVNKLYGKLR